MSYVEKHLMPGEQIEYRANLHWLVFVLPILLFIAAIWLFSLGGNIAKILAFILMVGVLVTGLIAVIERRTSEFAVTNKRVLIKTGLIRRHSLETLLSKIESIGVAQSILGRILGFGTIVISGTGGSKEPFHKIADPMHVSPPSARADSSYGRAPRYAKGRINAVSISSPCTTKRFPSSRCASAIQSDLGIVWPRDERDQLKREKEIHAFAAANGWLATILDPGIRVTFRKVGI